jgi:hypothetical protein
VTPRLVLISVVLAALAQSANGFADEPTEPEQLYAVGQAAFDAKQFDDAIAAWERSYTLSKEPGLLFNLGQAYRLRDRPGDCGTATNKYKEFMRLDPTSDQRRAARGFIDALSGCVAQEKPAPATPPPSPSTTTPGPQEHSGATKKLVGTLTAGGGVLLIATGIYFGHRASSLGDEVTTACVGGCDWAIYGPKDADGHRSERLQYVFEGIGIAAVIGGAALYVLGRRDDATAPVVVSAGRGAGSIAWSGSW